MSKESKFNKVIESGDNKYKLPGMYKDWFLDYASYVMLDRAVPYIEDGLKPVQRRILHALKLNEDGRTHKVAGIVGDTMKFHPHGDSSIYEALVAMQQKDLLIYGQGNWGNILTGDGAAAMRYIEAKLTPFALEVAFNSKITEWVPTYDKSSVEPVTLPIKFPLLLAHGSKGIGVGVRILILPHNFNELLDASVSALKGEDFELYPDFPTAGTADCSKYLGGVRGGRIKVRATISKRDKKTLVIEDIPYGETTATVIDSIVSANESGKIKIKKVDNYTSDHVEIVIQLANDISPDKTIDALYACTKCEVSISPNAVVIKDGRPEFLTVNEILKYSAHHTKDLFEKEFNVNLGELEDLWHKTSLEKIFFEQKVYKILENHAKSWEEQLKDVKEGMLQYQHLLKKPITDDDILMLVEKPVRKISIFDIKAADEKVKNIEKQIAEVQYNLANLTSYTIKYFQHLKKKYGAAFPRKTKLEEFETIQAQKVVVANAKLYAQKSEGFIGIDQKKLGDCEYICECSDIDNVIVFMKNGDYVVTTVKDKAFIGKDIIHIGIFKKGDDRSIYNVVYQDGKQGAYFVKRFSVTGITRNKMYNLTQGKEGSNVLWFTANSNGEAESLKIYYKPRPKIKKLIDIFDFADLMVKGRASRGNLLSKNPIQKILLKAKGGSTIGGKAIWFDADINRLNDAERGQYLGEFVNGDQVLVILKNGHYYTTSYDLVNKYQGDILQVEKLNVATTYSVVYFDGNKDNNYFYIKRFSFEQSENIDQCFISEANGSYMVAISQDVYPRIQVTYKGKNAGHAEDIIDVAEFIGKKGYKAKGKRVSSLEVDTVTFIEPIPVPALEIEESDTYEDTENDLGETPVAVVEQEAPDQSVETSEDEQVVEGDPIELTLF